MSISNFLIFSEEVLTREGRVRYFLFEYIDVSMAAVLFDQVEPR